MFIHIGNGNVIRSQDIIAIIDYHSIDASSAKNNVIGPTENAKSVVITVDMVYYTTISVATLQKRANIVSSISKLED
ncbi:DUF370 domain-containing protein [Oceanobacillus arenosus]|uniref:DUF370 domain-containing protein n=1 Tax=Oceanobacillus arenosus TaxID=1229153 RepID=A0A3D8PGP2_9BACI|nr:extracellular matrix/biofilm biosynthesis regulator RemA family protein [Oceanobacillus arenosus]RDW15256.1 DUF370 domain-containing protein [Oceanobacillus arenosus]